MQETGSPITMILDEGRNTTTTYHSQEDIRHILYVSFIGHQMFCGQYFTAAASSAVTAAWFRASPYASSGAPTSSGATG